MLLEASRLIAWGDWTRRQQLFFLITFAGGLGWNLFVLLSSCGWSLDDELSHYLRSRSVWENPPLIFDAWTRIGRNIFHLLPACFGLTTARIWTLVFAALSVLITTSLASKFGARRAWLIPLTLWFQPWFVELSWGVLTQTPFLLCLLAGIWLLTSQRWVLSGLCFGALPLIRHEGLALLVLWVFLLAIRAMVFGDRKIRHIFFAVLAGALPLILSNLAAWIYLGELPSKIFLNSKPTDIYGQGTLGHFIPVSLFPAGPFTLLLAAMALPWLVRHWRVTWPLLFYPAYFALHSVIYWLGLFASGGYYHFLMPMAPGLAVAAVFGANVCLDARNRWLPVVARILLVGALIQGVALLHVHAMQYWSKSPQGFGLTREPIHCALQDALDWQARHRPNAPVVICRHIFAAYTRDWIETPARSHTNFLPLGELPKGSIVIWEKKYSDLTGIPQSQLTASDSGWLELATFDQGTVRLFEKENP